MIKGRRPGRLRHSWEARCRVVGLVLDGIAPQAAAAACGTSRATAYRLLRRYQEGGWDGLRDRPPVPKRCPHRLSAEAEAQIVALRRRTGWGPRSLSAALGWPPSTIWRVLKRHGCSRQARMPRPPANRYEYAGAGELVHLDSRSWPLLQVGNASWRRRRRNRQAGWQHAHVAIDDHSRHAIVEVRGTETAVDCVAFTRAVISTTRSAAPPSSASSPTTATVPQPPLRRLLKSTASATSAPAPTPPAPTAKPKPSSASSNANGPTATSTNPAATAPKPSQAGPSGTTTTDHTAHSRPPTHQPNLTRCRVLQLAHDPPTV